MIYYYTPYSVKKNIGEYYNDCMAITPFGSWACFVDGDAMFTTPNFGHHLQQIIDYHNEYDLFTCVTNRVGTKYQCVEGMWEVDDMTTHRNVGKFLQQNKGMEVVDITNNAPMSGVLMLVKKSAWFNSDRFKEAGMLGIDNSIHYAIRNMGGKVGLMKGVYVMHYYRGGDMSNKSHLE
jgi:uncharacterized membrane protein